jgi:hypothetical protein
MAAEVWLGLTAGERSLLLEALAHYAASKRAEEDEIDAMRRKITSAKPKPWVTVRVDGGMVEEIVGNPFPVRLYDYDTYGVDDLEFDEDGRACVISEFEPQPLKA